MFNEPEGTKIIAKRSIKIKKKNQTSGANEIFILFGVVKKHSLTKEPHSLKGLTSGTIFLYNPVYLDVKPMSLK